MLDGRIKDNQKHNKRNCTDQIGKKKEKKRLKGCLQTVHDCQHINILKFTGDPQRKVNRFVATDDRHK